MIDKMLSSRREFGDHSGTVKELIEAMSKRWADGDDDAQKDLRWALQEIDQLLTIARMSIDGLIKYGLMLGAILQRDGGSTTVNASDMLGIADASEIVVRKRDGRYTATLQRDVPTSLN